MKHQIVLILSLALSCFATAQPDWKLSKEKDGIRIYTATAENSKYKSIRITCELTGTISKLQGILRDINNQKQWVYNTKSTAVIKQQSPDDIIYYLETGIPWPVTDRDGVYHITMQADEEHHSFSALVVSVPGYMPEKKGRIRILDSKATWQVTEAAGKINIDYTFEIDPRGSLPAWAVNMFSDKGPYETFKSLAALLKK